MIPRDLGGSQTAMPPTTVIVSGAGTAIELSAVAVMLQSREGGQKKLVKKAEPWLPYMEVAQTNLPIEAMLKFELVSIMTPSYTGQALCFVALFEKHQNQKRKTDIWILETMIKYLRCTTSAAANNGQSTTITPPL